MVAVDTDVAAPDLAAEQPRSRRRRVVVSGLVLLLAAAGVATYTAHPFRSAAGDETDNAAATKLTTVTRRTLDSQTQVDGTLTYDGSYSVVNQMAGTVTWLPALGRVLRQGGVLYRVDGTPVVLLYGSTPAYRDLAEGATADAVSGRDVRQLNAALVALGYATKAHLDPTSNEFGWRTKQAVERLQKHYGLDETGTLLRGQVVFLPHPIRVTAESASVGSGAPPGAAVLTATSTRRVVSVDLDVAQQSQVKRGDAVTVTLPDQSTTPGVVTKIGSVATTPTDGGDGSSNTPTIEVTVRLRRPAEAGDLDQAPVLVSIVTASARHALVVPVNALLSLASGGYAVEVAGGGGARHLVPVTLGLFDDADGLVQVTGTSLSAGQRIVVPAS
jgi:peptidoglycan hydrolase-like protein with peptidoglycan-binding domain